MLKNNFLFGVLLVGLLAILAGIVYRMDRPAEKQASKDSEFFAVYGIDRDINHEEINFYIKVPDSLSLLGKLEFVADRLSRFSFDSLPINVVGVEVREGKKVAIVDLCERENSSIYNTWRTGYFQGSAGGWRTSITLDKTFLQSDYKGEWIDWVEFLYEGKKISNNEWEHIYFLSMEDDVP